MFCRFSGGRAATCLDIWKGRCPMGKNHSISPQNSNSTTKSEGTNGFGALIRLLWMLIGPFAAAIIAVQIFQKRAGFGKYDVVFWCLVLLILAVRYVDMRFMNGRTASDEPATPQAYRSYAVKLLAVTIIGWGTLHAYLLLAR
jgi:hypothetical protein